MNYINFHLTLNNFKCVYNTINIKEIKDKFYCIIYDIYGVKLYKGYIKNGMPNGYGILYKNKKIMYIGKFKNGKIIDNKIFFDINEKKCHKNYYKYDSDIINKTVIEDNIIYIYVKQIDIYKTISIFNSIKKKLVILKYDINKNKPLNKLYYFIKELIKNKINLLDLKIIYLFIYNYNINNNINIHNEILIKLIKLHFYEFNIYIKKLKKKVKYVENNILKNDILKNDILKNDILKNDILNDNIIIIFNYINNLCLDYSNKNKKNIIINLDNIDIRLYKYKCKKEYNILLDNVILKNNIKINIDINDIINIFFIKIKNINSIININKKYNSSNFNNISSSCSSNSSNSNSINSNYSNSNSNISNNSNIEIDDIYLTAKIKNLFIIEKNDILNYNKFMLSIHKKLMYKIKNKNKNKIKNINKINNKTKNNIIKSNSCKDIILLCNKINTLEKIYNINIKNSNTHKLNTFEKNKIIKKAITKLFKKNLNNIKLEIENKYGKILDEDWIYYLSLLHKYLPILIKKRIYTKTISTQTQNNIKLLQTNLIEKTYL
jgi:hypothetical protein